MVLSGGGWPDGDSHKLEGRIGCQDRNAGEPSDTGVVAIEIEFAGGLPSRLAWPTSCHGGEADNDELSFGEQYVTES